jgi:hypothetical protein
MPQFQLPIFPPGLTAIDEDLSFQQVDGKVVYFPFAPASPRPVLANPAT